MSKETKMNRAQMKEPKSGHHSPAKGNAGNTSIRTAVEHLESQHPEHHMDRGPHHGGKKHITHEPKRHHRGSY